MEFPVIGTVSGTTSEQHRFGRVFPAIATIPATPSQLQHDGRAHCPICQGTFIETVDPAVASSPDTNKDNQGLERLCQQPTKLGCCGHVFGASCLSRWLQDGAAAPPEMHRSCPMCRRILVTGRTATPRSRAVDRALLQRCEAAYTAFTSRTTPASARSLLENVSARDLGRVWTGMAARADALRYHHHPVAATTTPLALPWPPGGASPDDDDDDDDDDSNSNTECPAAQWTRITARLAAVSIPVVVAMLPNARHPIPPQHPTAIHHDTTTTTTTPAALHHGLLCSLLALELDFLHERSYAVRGKWPPPPEERRRLHAWLEDGRLGQIAEVHALRRAGRDGVWARVERLVRLVVGWLLLGPWHVRW